MTIYKLAQKYSFILTKEKFGVQESQLTHFFNKYNAIITLGSLTDNIKLDLVITWTYTGVLK